MKKSYTPPGFSVTVVDIENSLCNASSTIAPSTYAQDIISEYETGPDEERTFNW